MIKKYTAAGLAVKLGDLVLLGRRSCKSSSLAGNWSIPCGMIEAGENPERAAKREFFEETGIKPRNKVDFLDDFEMSDNNFFALFSMKTEDLMFPKPEAIDAIEHDEWGFFKLDENCLPSPMTEETKRALLKLK